MSAGNRRRREAKTQPRSIVVLCARIGQAPRVPAGYATADCRRCGSAVWIDPATFGLGRRLRMRVDPLCNECSGLTGS